MSKQQPTYKFYKPELKKKELYKTMTEIKTDNKSTYMVKDTEDLTDKNKIEVLNDYLMSELKIIKSHFKDETNKKNTEKEQYENEEEYEFHDEFSVINFIEENLKYLII